MGIVSFGLYASAAFALWHVCLQQFELLVDRPTRPLPPYPGYADLRGIRFVEDTDLDPPIGRDEDEDVRSNAL